MRILCVSNDIPLPANSGGRVDVWRRMSALHEAGHTLGLVCWVDVGRGEPPSQDVLAKLGEVCSTFRVTPITRSVSEIVQRLAQLWRWPSHVASRWVSSRNLGLVAWAEAFRPDVVLLDGLYGGAVAMDLANRLKCPLWYRSHNIEHRYMAAQHAREPHWKRRLGLAANRIGLEAFERSVFKRAARVFDISQADAAFWRGEGFRHVEWVPTLVDRAFASRLAACSVEKRYDLLYFGNLNTPNNVEAISWFVRQVLPLIDGDKLKIVIAGSRPSPEVRSLVGLDRRITLLENPVDMAEVVGQARVLVNSMLAGSGVNLKSVEMLFSDAGLVSTSVGVAGLSESAKRCFTVADSPQGFASAVLAALGTVPDVSERIGVRASFSQALLIQAFELDGTSYREGAAC